MLHCSKPSEHFQPLAENKVANLVEVAVHLLTTFLGNSWFGQVLRGEDGWALFFLG